MSDQLNNPALARLGVLIGVWHMALSGASFLPDPNEAVHGRVEIQPIEEGGVLTIRQFIDEIGPPAAVWLVGCDDSQPDFTVLYADARSVSRVYSMRISETHWHIWRDDPAFAQRFDATIGADGRQIVGRWEKRGADGTWEHDFNVTYSRLEF